MDAGHRYDIDQSHFTETTSFRLFTASEHKVNNEQKLQLML